MNKYIVTLYNSKENSLTTIELKLNNLTEVEQMVQYTYDGWAKITAIIVTL